MSTIEEPAETGTGDRGSSHEAVLAHTLAGTLEGARVGPVNRFLGVPYGEPPVGRLRFHAPEPFGPWDGVRQATALGAQCAQSNPDLPAWADLAEESEDCLFLNVWSPAERTTDLPVMVWLHGGGFVWGSAGAPVYDGATLAERGDVVVVSVNHRLNVFGYAWFGDLVPELAEHANPGQLDLELALRWVRDNAAVFGGDASNITVFGESGGGGKVSTLCSSSSADGLFDKMIIQSAAPASLHDRASATTLAAFLLDELGIESPTEAALQAIGTERLKAAAAALGEAHGPLAFRPVVDGAHVTTQLWSDDALTAVGDLPLLIGTTSDEAVAFDPALGAGEPDDVTLVEQLATSLLAPALTHDEWSLLIEAYRGLMPNEPAHRATVALLSDVSFWAIARDIIGLRADATGATFAFEFAWPTPCYGSAWSPHSGELPFVFGNLLHASAWDGEDDDALRAAADVDGRRFALSAVMIDAWSSFARHGDPSTSSIQWRRWSATEQGFMLLDEDTPRVVHHWKADRWPLLRDLPRPW